MNSNTKERLINIIDRAAFFFFIVLVFFLPISNAIIESSFGFIFLCFILRTILKSCGIALIECLNEWAKTAKHKYGLQYWNWNVSLQ